MTKNQNSKRFDLEDRTFDFAKSTVLFVKQLPKNISNLEYGRQAIDASGSVGANYIEANEALSKKDFTMRIKICRKEAKETAYWLRLIVETNDEKYSQYGMKLFDEARVKKDIFFYSCEIRIVLVIWSIVNWILFVICNLNKLLLCA